MLYYSAYDQPFTRLLSFKSQPVELQSKSKRGTCLGRARFYTNCRFLWAIQLHFALACGSTTPLLLAQETLLGGAPPSTDSF
jgi:hypothetical protein